MKAEYEIYKAEFNEALNRLEITDSLESLVWCDRITLDGRAKHREAVEAYIERYRESNKLAVFTIYAAEGVEGGGVTALKFFVHSYGNWEYTLTNGLARHADRRVRS